MPAKRKNKRVNKKEKAVKAAAAEAEAAIAGLNDDIKKGEVLKKLGVDAFISGSYRAAIIFFDHGLELKGASDMYSSLLSNRSACYGKLGDWKAAAEDAEKCIEAKPDWPKAYHRLGVSLLHQGRHMDAQKTYQRGLKVDPKNTILMDAVMEVRAIIRRKLNKEAEKKARRGDDQEEEEPVQSSIGGAGYKRKKKDKETLDREAAIGEYVIGIDLGTTFSCVAVWRNGKAEVLENADGKRTTPSWVAFTDEERLVGEQAKNNASINPRRTLFNIKRIIGRQFTECREDINLMPFDVKKARGGKPVIEVDIDGKGNYRKFAPEQISAMVLERMKETAEAALGVKITKAVVTVPAYFNDSQRRLTKAAGAIAGLDVLRIINEPTAAALAYGLDKKDKGATNVLVFDLGGGTFDVSLLKIEDGVFRVLATAGDTHLGGEDFDSTLCQWAVNQVRKENDGKDLVTGDTKLMRKLRNACERAKRQLSTTQTATIEFVMNGKDIELSVSRSQFESLNEKIFQRCMNSVKQVLGDSKVAKEDVDDIVLVGGSTRVPRVREILSKYFNGKELSHSVHPDEAVAYGAAVQGAILSGVRDPKTQALLLVDVTPLSLGVETQGKQFAKVLPRNSNVPCKRSSEFTTCADYQTSIDIRIFEGERQHCDGNHLLGEFAIHGVERAKKGEAKVQVTFEVNTNGLLTVTAYDKITGAEADVEIEHDRGRVSADDIERMCIEAAMLKEHDEKRVAEREAAESGAAAGPGADDDDDW